MTRKNLPLDTIAEIINLDEHAGYAFRAICPTDLAAYALGEICEHTSKQWEDDVMSDIDLGGLCGIHISDSDNGLKEAANRIQQYVGNNYAVVLMGYRTIKLDCVINDAQEVIMVDPVTLAIFN